MFFYFIRDLLDCQDFLECQGSLWVILFYFFDNLSYLFSDFLKKLASVYNLPLCLLPVRVYQDKTVLRAQEECRVATEQK